MARHSCGRRRIFREVLADALSRHAFRVIGADDGLALISKVRELKEKTGASPDVVLSDVRMPGASGMHVLRWARHFGVRCPFVVLTAYDDDAVQRMAECMGKTVVLTKPASIDTICQTARAVIGRR
jgi:DNA-binding response OmpR family regulator